jgi:uncharacterized phage protein (TIGR02218 family)
MSADPLYRVMCLRIETLGGLEVRLTAHPRDLVIAGSPAVTYLTASGYQFTGFSAASTSSPAMVDLEGIAGVAGIDRDTVASGVFDGARAFLFATTWHTPIEDEEPITSSIMGKTTLSDERYRIEEMALVDALNQTVGRTYQPTCYKEFGGQEFAGCKIDLGPITVTGTLTHVGPVRDSTRAEVADYFAYGTIALTSGPNAGLPPLEIKSYAADGTIVTFQPFHYAAQVGDTYTMIPGCRKRLVDCRDKWDNVINFGGFTFVPIGSKYSQVGNK